MALEQLRSAPARFFETCRALEQAGTVALAAFAAAALGAGLGRAIVTTYLPVLLARIENAPGLIGTVMLVNPIAGFFVPLVVGVWSDRLRGTRGRRMPFIVGGTLLTASGLAAVALGQGSSYLALAAAGTLAYVGLNAVTTAHRALVPVCFSAGARPRATGAQEVAALVGSLAGIVVGGSLIEVEGWAPFAVAAAAASLAALPTIARVREPQAEPSLTSEWRGFGYYRRAILRKGVRALLVAQILWVLGYAALPAFFVVYAQRVLGLEPSVASLWLAGFGLATGALMVAAGRVRNPDWHPPLLGLGVVLMGSGFLGVATTTNLVLVGGALITAAAGFGLISTLGFPLFSSLIPEEEEGAYSALYFSSRAVASAIALPAAGWAVAATGSYRTLFLFGAIATLAALVPLLRACSTSPVRPIRLALRWPEQGWWLRWAGAGIGLYGLLQGALLLTVFTPLERADAWLFRVVNNNLAPGPEFLWDALNPHLRNYLLLNVLAVAAAALIRRRWVPHTIVLLTVSWLLSFGLLEALHVTYNRPRPEEALGGDAVVLGGHTWSFIASYPSGHMAITAALVTGTGLLFPRLRVPLWIYAAAVAFTRVIFGAHFPLDVLAGTLLGWASARLAHALLVETRLLDLPRPGPPPPGYEQPVVAEAVEFLEPAALGRPRAAGERRLTARASRTR